MIDKNSLALRGERAGDKYQLLDSRGGGATADAGEREEAEGDIGEEESSLLWLSMSKF